MLYGITARKSSKTTSRLCRTKRREQSQVQLNFATYSPFCMILSGNLWLLDAENINLFFCLKLRTNFPQPTCKTFFPSRFLDAIPVDHQMTSIPYLHGLKPTESRFFHLPFLPGIHSLTTLNSKLLQPRSSVISTVINPNHPHCTTLELEKVKSYMLVCDCPVVLLITIFIERTQ